MDDTITFRTKLTVDDSIVVGTFLRNQSWFYRYDIVLTSSIVFFGFWIAIVLMSDDISAINVIGAVVFSSVPAILVGISVAFYHKLVIPVLARPRVAKLFKSSPAADDEVLIILSDEGVTMNGNLSSTAVKWEAITKAQESETHLLFYSSSGPPFLFFRKSEIDAKRTAIEELLRRKLGAKAQLTKLV